MSDKPKPIRNVRVKGRRIWRIPDKGFVLPRLNEPTIRTEVVGFLDRREYEWDGGAYLRADRET